MAVKKTEKIININNYKKKRTISIKLLKKRLILFAVATLSAIILSNYVKLCMNVSDGEQKIVEIQRKIAVEQKKNKTLKAELAISDSKEYIEYLARSELGLIKDGEKILVLENNN